MSNFDIEGRPFDYNKVSFIINPIEDALKESANHWRARWREYNYCHLEMAKVVSLRENLDALRLRSHFFLHVKLLKPECIDKLYNRCTEWIKYKDTVKEIDERELLMLSTLRDLFSRKPISNSDEDDPAF